MARMSWRMVAAALCGLGLAVLSAPAVRVSAHEAVAAGLPPRTVQVVEITAERFSFTPSEIHATAGVPLEIRLESEDTDHGFRIIGTDVNIEIPKRGRGTTTVTFKAEKAGRYTFECSQLCGAGHSFMRGVIVVADAPPR